MFCPECGGEFVEGIERCGICNVALAHEPPSEDPLDDADALVPVLRTGDPLVVALAKSLLDGADIDFFVKGEGIQDLFAFGRVGTGFSPVTGPAEFQVRRAKANEARTVLADVYLDQQEHEGEADDAPADETPEN
jgi:hypothetical protein